jgi:hypothetical protein
MNRQALYLALCFIIGFLTTGCGDDKNTVSFPEGGAFYHTVVYNSSNPYNWYGEQHNAGLSYGFALTPYASMTNEKAAEHTANFIIQISGAGAVNDFESEDYQALYDYANGLEGYNTMTTDQLLDALDLLPQQRSYMSQTMAAINLVATDPDAAISQINNIENAILGSTLTDAERVFPLLLVSIVKHSGDYWLNDAGINTSTPTGLATVKSALAADGKGCLKGTLTGAAAGALGGFFGGSWAGPAGSGAGALGGALNGGLIGGFIGAITGSLGATIPTNSYGND